MTTLSIVLLCTTVVFLLTTAIATILFVMALDDIPDPTVIGPYDSYGLIHNHIVDYITKYKEYTDEPNNRYFTYGGCTLNDVMKDKLRADFPDDIVSIISHVGGPVQVALKARKVVSFSIPVSVFEGLSADESEKLVLDAMAKSGEASE